MELASPESLPSEDWISQPRSSAPVSEKKDSSVSVPSNNALRSRIPRLNGRSVSSFSLPSRQPPGSPAPSPGPCQGHILSERTASDINIIQRPRPGLQEKFNKDLEQSPRLQLGKRQASLNSVDSAQLGTVQHRNKPCAYYEEEKPHSTPEWRKRILVGRDTSCRQPDLFSPVGLESVFRAPKPKQQSPKQRQDTKPKRYEPTETSDYPSSPPLFHSAIPTRSTAITGNNAVLRKPSPKVHPSYTKSLHSARSRIESGESVSRNEEISLVQVANGRISYENGSRTDSRHSKLAHSISSSRSRLREDGQCSDLTTHSLPEGLSIDTEAYISNGGFVNVLRGGCSNDDSFQRRPLSPSSFQPSDVPIPNSEIMAPNINQSQAWSHSPVDFSCLDSAQAPAMSPVPPITPTKNQSNGNDPPKSSGSPLKLFDAYDTYTNNCLVRRMSQFAGGIPDSPTDDLPRNEEQRSPSAHKSQSASVAAEMIHGQRATSFGSGDLDEYGFTHGRLAVLDRSFDDNSQFQNIRPKLSELHPKALSRCRSTRLIVAKSQRHRANSKIASKPKSLPLRASPFSEQLQPVSNEGDCLDPETIAPKSLQFQHEDYETHNVDGKRFPTSPIRDPHPKRRRTVTRSLDEISAQETRESAMNISTAKSVVSRKRKDARYDSVSQVIDPAVLASRPMLRPRIPSSNQAQTICQEASIQKSKGTPISGESGIASVKSTLVLEKQLSLEDTPIKALAGELAHFAFDVVQDITYGDRKTSVTTADFTTAANLIMQNIRAQARPRSGRTSGEESEMEQLADICESANEGSTIEEFSRPPSRVRGGTLRGLRGTKQLDPRVLSHLRKFEENDETGIVLSSSLRSLKVGREDLSGDSSIVESDPPNIRIIGSLDGGLLNHCGDFTNREIGQGTTSERQSLSHRSPLSSQPSTTRSIPTGSSSGSGNKAMIAPDKVSHLISDNVGGMTFDRTRQIWVRKRSADNTSDEDVNKSGNDLTEDDPLKEIPDLSVDELDELRRIQNTTLTSQSKSAHTLNTSDGPTEEKRHLSIEGGAQSPTLSKAHISILSKHSELVSDGSRVRTGATSPVLHTSSGKKVSHESRVVSGVSEEYQQADSEEVEHEISILEGRSVTTPKHTNPRYRQPRVVTVAFSSPLTGPVQIENIGAHGFDGKIWEDNGDFELDYSSEDHKLKKKYASSRRVSTEYRSHASFRARPRISASKRSFTARPISRIDEHDELSTDPNTGQFQNLKTDPGLSTPQPLSYRPGDMVVPPPSTGLRSNISFHLSPLSDFTVHRQEDSSKPLAPAGLTLRLLSLHGSDETYSLAIKELVEKITDVEPYELYWECIRKLDLRSKSLASLHLLEDFCPRIEELDVSDNNLGQLDGAPSSVRVLQVRRNCLSDLTAWGQFHDLQYLDVSRNEIRSLHGFSGLIHLRELKADDNHIESLDGIANLNGLIKLSLRRNALKSLNFGGYDLQRLVELDIQGNQITAVSNLHDLPEITHINLRDNKLTDFAGGLPFPVPALRFLDISNNSVTDMDISNLPNIQTLYLDSNHVTNIMGVQHLSNLATVAWRNQTDLRTNVNIPIRFEDFQDLKTLQLSGNKLQSFDLTTSFLNLQQLELSSAGLDCLSKSFGIQVPNLRFLNLNNNAIKDLRPLLGIAKLTNLHIAGNRISRLRQTTTVLRKVGGALESVDLRGNPLTVGFYGTSSVSRNMQQQLVMKTGGWFDDPEEENVVECIAAKYIIPPGDSVMDQQHRETVSEDTALRRRVYEMLLTCGCPSLTRLDGLRVDRGMIKRRDMIWKRLLELGVLKAKEIRVKSGSMEIGTSEKL